VNRSVAIRATPGPTGRSDARLALAEFLLKCEVVHECALWSLEWLGDLVGVRRAACFLVDHDANELGAVAVYGGAPSTISRMTISLDQRDHPLVAALRTPRPIQLSPSTFGPRLRRPPLRGSAPFLVLPLGHLGDEGSEAPGLILLSPAPPNAVREATWLAGILGRHLTRLRAVEQRAAAYRRLEGELVLVQGMINTVPDPILLTDVEGRVVLANARAEALLVATERESEGRRRAIALNNMLFSAALTGRAIQRTEMQRRELLLVDPVDGSDLLFELISAVTHEPTGNVVVVSVLRNVMDLRRAAEEMEENYRKLRLVEEEVRAERDRLDLIIDSVADPILVTDPGGVTLLMNAPAEKLFAAASEAASEVLVRVQSNDAHFSSFHANVLFASGTIRHTGEIGLVNPETGESFPVEAVAGKVFSQQGELIGIVTILHDLTQARERERLYAELKRASEQLEDKVREATAELVRQNELLRRQAFQLEHASALKSQFLANMSHEFRTPLNAILGYTNMLLQGISGEVPPPQRKSLSRIDSSAQHLLALINDILDISRIEAGKMPIHVGDCAIADLVGEIVAEVEPIVSRTKLTLMREINADLPLVQTDRAKVKQVVINLLTNALKFTPEGWVKIAASYDRASDRVVIAVSDTGIGIADEDQARIFEDFTQADSSSTRAFGGAGLGLSISRRLVTMLGGQLTLTSKVGKGSTFTLSVPRSMKR